MASKMTHGSSPLKTGTASRTEKSFSEDGSNSINCPNPTKYNKINSRNATDGDEEL